MSFTCNECSVIFDTKQHLLQHQNKKNKCISVTRFRCKECKKYFKQNKNLIDHTIKLICKKNKQNELIKSLPVEEKKIPINNQLINIIVDKSNTINNLKNEIKQKEEIISNQFIELLSDNKLIYSKYIFNNTIIAYRNKDNYLNALHMCKAFDKDFNEWYNLDSTKKILDEYKIEYNLSLVELIENGNEIWIHPDFAIYLAYWISSKFGLDITKLIRTNSTNIDKLNNFKSIENLDNDNKLKDYKIKLLENSFIKKQKRIDYPDKNLIYLITTDENKKNRNYIIGKATDLKNRLSSYNKTAEHEVIYYKSCGNESDMNLTEQLVLNRLNIYREQANRDRFILPIEKDISLFINIINNCINFIKSEN